MPALAPGPSRSSSPPKRWLLDKERIKRYAHFDAPISSSEAEDYVNDPVKVANHSFYPFLLFKNQWTKFAKKGEIGKKKTRKIRYAARLDSYIYMRYREILSVAYEEILNMKGISDNVVAYRKIVNDKGQGKSNIEIAKEVFDNVRVMGNCVVVTADISDFFESLDHNNILEKWKNLTGNKKLPRDHHAVYSAITRYAEIDRLAVLER